MIFEKGEQTLIIKKYYPAKPGQKPQLKECCEVDAEGRKNGFFKSWWPNGQEHITAAYLEDKPIKTWEERYPNGRLAIQKSYDPHGSGQLEGSYQSWRVDGSREVSGNYTQDKPIGTFITWNADNNIRSVVSYMAGGLPHGDSIDYTDEYIIQTHYHHATKDSEQISKGSQTESIQMLNQNNVCQIERRYNPNRVLVMEETTYRDQGEKEKKTYYPSMRQIHSVAKTDASGLQTYKVWSEAHRLIEEGTKQNGVLIGVRKLYYDVPSSPLREECSFENGVEEGMCTQYTEHGKPVARYKMHQGERVPVIPDTETLFGKKYEKNLRDDLAKKLRDVLNQPEQRSAVVAEVLAYHGEKSDFPRHTALRRRRDADKARS